MTAGIITGADAKPDTSKARLAHIPREIAAPSDYEYFAKERLDENAWTYLTSGAADEITLRENHAAFERIRLKGKVLTDVRGGHTKLTLFGHTYDHPVFLAPVAYQKLFHPDGELATVLGADAMDAGMTVSTLASTSIEEIAAASQAPLWFQLYIQADRAQTMRLIQRAEDSGYKALVITVDAPIAGIRNREHRAGFSLPPSVSAVNLVKTVSTAKEPAVGQSIIFNSLMHAAPTWQDIEWITAYTSLPVIVKGILDADDALQAISHGANGIIVSNHGGRTLDTLPATIEALPLIATAVSGRVPVLLDGGVRRGIDIFKAIALGASAVLIGRPYIYALATAGALGVAHLVRTFREELEITMALSGCSTLDTINRNRLFHPA